VDDADRIVRHVLDDYVAVCDVKAQKVEETFRREPFQLVPSPLDISGRRVTFGQDLTPAQVVATSSPTRRAGFRTLPSLVLLSASKAALAYRAPPHIAFTRYPAMAASALELRELDHAYRPTVYVSVYWIFKRIGCIHNLNTV